MDSGFRRIPDEFPLPKMVSYDVKPRGGANLGQTANGSQTLRTTMKDNESKDVISFPDVDITHESQAGDPIPEMCPYLLEP